MENKKMTIERHAQAMFKKHIQPNYLNADNPSKHSFVYNVGRCIAIMYQEIQCE